MQIGHAPFYALFINLVLRKDTIKKHGKPQKRFAEINFVFGIISYLLLSLMAPRDDYPRKIIHLIAWGLAFVAGPGTCSLFLVPARYDRLGLCQRASFWLPLSECSFHYESRVCDGLPEVDGDVGGEGRGQRRAQMGDGQSGVGGERSQLYIACLSRRPGVDPDGVGHHEIDTRHA